MPNWMFVAFYNFYRYSVPYTYIVCDIQKHRLAASGEAGDDSNMASGDLPPAKRQRKNVPSSQTVEGKGRHSTTSGANKVQPIAKRTWTVPSGEEKAGRGGERHKKRGDRSQRGGADSGWGGRSGRPWAPSGANAVVVG